MEPACGVCFVRGFVARESNVAIDPKHAAFRIAVHLRGEARKTGIHLTDQIAHWLTDFALVIGAVSLEPFLVVVLLQLTEELKRCRAECHSANLSPPKYVVTIDRIERAGREVGRRGADE